MKHPSPSIEALVRHAFDLLLQIRNRPEAPSRLGQAVAFLKLLAREKDAQSNPLLITVQAVRIRET